MMTDIICVTCDNCGIDKTVKTNDKHRAAELLRIIGWTFVNPDANNFWSNIQHYCCNKCLQSKHPHLYATKPSIV